MFEPQFFDSSCQRLLQTEGSIHIADGPQRAFHLMSKGMDKIPLILSKEEFKRYLAIYYFDIPV